MSKAFTKEDQGNDDLEPQDEADEGEKLPQGFKNYMTPACAERLRGALKDLLYTQRPEVVRTVSWAASNGDRSENGDYIYGKKRLREIDRRVRYLSKRLANAEVVDSAKRGPTDQVFFGATVTFIDDAEVERTVTIVGIDVDGPDTYHATHRCRTGQ